MQGRNPEMQRIAIRNKISGAALVIALVFQYGCGRSVESQRTPETPNILFVIADDQSWPHASAYGASGFSTPAFDSIARAGVLFGNAFVAAPQCSPSRAAILTGRNIWQLEEAGTHSSYFPKKFPVFTRSLEAAGYKVGFTGKAWGPGNWKDAGWQQNPVGKEYNDLKHERVPSTGISRTDYVSNFKAFLAERDPGQPFFFWFGAHEPHRAYGKGSGTPGNALIKIPGFLPEDDSVVNDLGDYSFEISWYDSQLRKMLDVLEQDGTLANTLIVVTADNGMPFPLAKANLQEYGIHVPLAICGPSVAGGRKVDALVSLIDLAPTILEITGCDPMPEITGRSLLPLMGDKLQEQDRSRDFVLAGRERHTHARPDNAGYPARAIRTSRFLYIRNFKPDRWPMGDPPPLQNAQRTDDPEAKPVTQGYEDVDDGPAKRVLLAGRRKWPELFNAAFGMRPAEQLYDITNDPYCLNDLSADAAYKDVLSELGDKLLRELTAQGDPRASGRGDIFDTYPRFGAMRAFPGFRKRGAYAPMPEE